MTARQNLGPIISDSSFLRSKLYNLDGNINIGHLNCTSFNLNPNSSKFSEIKRLLEDSNLNVFGVSETWLKGIVSTAVIDIPGYVCHRSDRPCGRGGGVALYISSTIGHKIVHVGVNFGVLECLFVELYLGNVKLLVGVVYLPHGNFDLFEDEISDLLVRYNDIIIMGDFNNNLFDHVKSLRVRNICNRMNLSLIHNSMPTHYDVSHNSTSLLDCFLVSSPELVRLSDQFQCPGITRHSFIFLSIEVPRFIGRQFFEFYDYDSVNIGRIESMFSECGFDGMYLTSSVDEQLIILNNGLQLLHSAVPLKRRMIRRCWDGWINAPEIRYHLSLRDLAYRAYLVDRTNVNWKKFCRCRNKAKMIIRKFKRSAHGLIFHNKDSKEIWSILKRNGVVDNDSNYDSIDPDYLNNVFSSNQSTCDDIIDTSIYPHDGFSFRTVELFEMLKAFELIKSMAVGYDGFGLKFIRILMPFIGCYVLHLVNTIMTTSSFPLLWKVARIVPLSKNSGIGGDIDFRPISILPILSKMVEHLIKIQLVKHIDDGQLLNDCQTGFRCNRNTTSLLLGLTDNIRRCVSDKGNCVLLSLDLAKAFDRVNHSILVGKLHRYYGFSSSACKLISSYLSDRKQYVCSGGSISGLLPVYSGVPQGSVLGPLLFIMFINDLFSRISSSICLPFSFADDVQLLFKGDVDFPDVLQSVIDHTADLLFGWVQDNDLSVNASKTKAMLFGRCSNNNFSVTLGNNMIEFVDKLKCLGVILDRELNFDSHVNSVVSRVNFTLRKLYSLDLMLPFHIKRRVVHSLIMPIFLYALEVYSGTFGYVVKRLRLTFNRVVRYLYSLKMRQHVSMYVLKFLGLSFMDFIKFRNLLHFYKLFKLQVPEYLVNLFEFCKSNRNRQLKIPMLTSILERSYCVRVARVYNKLPNTLRGFDVSVETYKKKLFCELSQNNLSL